MFPNAVVYAAPVGIEDHCVGLIFAFEQRYAVISFHDLANDDRDGLPETPVRHP
jgi:hypothetical protein